MRLKFSFAEMIIRFELNDMEYLETLLAQTSKTFSTILQDEDYKREKLLAEIMALMLDANNLVKNKNLNENITEFLSIISSKEAADKDIINYNDWLEAKIR